MNTSKYYEVRIEKTSRSFMGVSYGWYDTTTETFGTLEEVRAFIDKMYGKCKKIKMYKDDKQGNAQHIGYIRSYVETDYSTQKKYIEEHWITVKKVCKSFDYFTRI